MTKEAPVKRGEAFNKTGDTAAPTWLLRQKIMLPNLPKGFVARPALDALCDPLRTRLTAVHAPGGFGKTTFLAAICRRERNSGRVSAWVSLDADDDPRSIVDYLSFAFVAAGLDILGGFAGTSEFEDNDRRLNKLVHSIEVHGNPCLLVLDEVDSLGDETVRVLDWLLHNAPSNLHIALTCRVLPRGLDLATYIAQGVGISVTTEHLRFATREIARFCGDELSRRELAELRDQSRGWPIALWIHRNAAGGQRSEAAARGSDVAANWFDKRLMRGLSNEVQALVLDAGLFEWLQEPQVDEVLGVGTMRQLRSTPALAGLLQSAGGASGTAYLHPLLRQYCVDRRLRETPERYRAVHRALAGTLSRAGQIVPAVRHAREADDPRLAGEIVDRAGGWQLWFRDGVARLHSVNALLTDRIIAQHPHLAIVRCMALTMVGETDAARRLFTEVRARLENLAADRPELVLEVDAGIALYRVMIGFISCAPVGGSDMRETFAKVENLAVSEDLDVVTSAAASYAMIAVETARSGFESATRWARRARMRTEPYSRYFTTYVDVWGGIVAMATGRGAEAAETYARAEALATPNFMRDPGPAMVTDVLIGELDLERNRLERLAHRAHPIERLAEAGAWLDVFVAATDLLAEVVERERGPEAAGRVVRDALVFARRTARVTLVRCLSARRITDLVASGQIEEAERLWTDSAFPARLADCAQLRTQTWREMEAVTCAGLRLALASERFEEGRELAEAVLPLCRERQLVRTRLRALALAMVLEHRAGDAGAAAGHLVEYLRTFPRTDYVRPMIEEQSTALVVLGGLGDVIGADLEPAAAGLRGILVGGPPRDDGDRVPALSEREHEILERLEHAQDKMIAVALNLSVGGVRYHVSSLFRKLGVDDRREAVRRARSLGLFPSAEDR